VDFPAFQVPFQIRVIRHEGVEIQDVVDKTFLNQDGETTTMYVDPHKGQGFTAEVRVKLPNGDVYTRSKAYGRYGTDQAWTKYEPPALP